MTLTIDALGRMTPDQLRELESSLSTNEGQEQAYAIAQELLQRWDGQPNTRGRVVGFGSRGDLVRAVQLITRAAALRDGVDDARDALTVDGIFGNDTREAVGLGQAALRERSDHIAGKYYALSHVNALAGLQPPEGGSFRARREAIREAMRNQPEQFAAPAPLPGETIEPSPLAPDPRPPAVPVDAAGATAAIAAARELQGDARVAEYRGIAGAAAANPDLIAGVVAGLTQLPGVEPIREYLQANDDLDNSAVIAGLRQTQHWGVLRYALAQPAADVTGLSSRLLDQLAGDPPAAATGRERDVWQALRMRAVVAKAREGGALDRRDFDNVVAANDPATLGLLVRGPRDQAAAALRSAVDRLGPEPAATLLGNVHGALPPNPGAATPEQRSRWQLTHSVLQGVFGAEGVTDTARYNFFANGVAREGQPFFTTMDDATYAALREKIQATGSDWSWWYGGDRAVRQQLDRFDAERARWQAAGRPTVPTSE